MSGSFREPVLERIALKRVGRASATCPILAAVLIVTGGCTSRASGPSQTEAENEIAMRTLVDRIAAADGSDVADLFFPDATYDDFANQRQYQGYEEIAGYIQGGSRWATGVSIDILDLRVSEWGAVAEWVFTGIQDHPIGSTVPIATGREVVLNGVTIIETEGGRIKHAADYTDGLTLALQLGGELHMPGGGLLKLDLPPVVGEEAPSGAEADTLMATDTPPPSQELR